MNKKKIISYTVDVILVLIIIFLGYVQISMMVTKGNNYGVPQVFGKSFLYVATDSMNNPEDKKSLSPGTGIVIEDVKDLSKLKVSNPIYGDEEHPELITDYDYSGDIVTFYLPSIGAPDTHRLIDRDYNEKTGKYTFRTMGDNPTAHQRMIYEEWDEQYLIGKVIYSSKGLGNFLAIASPDAANSAGKKAWFFPVAIITPIVLLATYYIVDAIIKYRKETKAIEAKITEAMIASGIDMNDEEAKELFRMKELLRLEYQEEYEKMKKKLRKEIEKRNRHEK